MLSQKGAYSPQERYTALDVAEVVEFGRERGVRMMVEIDGPGHAAIWCKGYPEICPSPSCLEPLNPATNATYELLDDLLEDLTGGTRGSGLFYDNVMHLGGDEVNTACCECSHGRLGLFLPRGSDRDRCCEQMNPRPRSPSGSRTRA